MEESLTRKSLFGTIMNVLGAIIAYVGFFFIARMLPDNQGAYTIGLIAFSTGYVATFLPVSKLGYVTAHVKKVSEGADEGECNGAFMLITAALTVLMVLIVAGSIFLWTLVLHRGFESAVELDAIWIMLGYTVVTTVSNVPVTTFNAKREVVKGQIGTFVGHVVRVGAIVIIVMSRLAVIDIIWAYFLGALASLLVSFYYFGHNPLKRPGSGILGEYRKFARPLLFTSILAPLPVALAPVIVQYFSVLGSSASGLLYTGYFGSSYRLVAVFAAISVSVSSVIFPKLSELHSKGRFTEIESGTRTSEKLLAFILAPITLFVAVYPVGVIIVLLKGAFLPAVLSLIILSVYIYVSGVSAPKISLLPALNEPRLYGGITAMGSILSIVLMLVFVPSSLFGIKLPGLKDYGAAAALLAGALFTYVVTHHFSRRIAGTRFQFRVILFPVLALLSCLLLLPITAAFPEMHWTWYTALSFAIGTVLLYLLLSLVTRMIKWQEIMLLYDSLNPFAMHKYVRSELIQRYGKN